MIIFKYSGCHDSYPLFRSWIARGTRKSPGKAGGSPRAASKAVYTAPGVPSILEEWRVEKLKRGKSKS
jgi:hypothetical protein